MAKRTATLSAQNSNVFIGTAHKPRGSDTYYASIFVNGDFGEGTVSIQGSPDGGTTKITLDDPNGDAMEFTANAMKNVQLGNANVLGEELLLYAAIGSATDPSVTITVLDNLG